MRKLTVIGTVLTLFLGLGTCVTPAAAANATLTVTKTDDTNDGICDADCSLREAVAIANTAGGADTIKFNIPSNDLGCASANVCTLKVEQLFVEDDLTIDGTGQDITISGDDITLVMSVGSGKTLNLIALTIAHGNGFSGRGGGVFNNGTLNVTDCTFLGNLAPEGGAIFNYNGTLSLTDGTLNVTGSTFSGNAASGSSRTLPQSGSGGAIFNGDGTRATVTNSTFSDNLADADGGAIFNYNGTVKVTNCTFSGNSAVNFGGAVYHGTTVTPPTLLTLRNTILAHSTAGNCFYFNGLPITDGGGNLSDDTSCPFSGSSVNGTDPLLDAPAGNGGPTQTMALLPGSPAIDAGVNALALDVNDQPLTKDQRGSARISPSGGTVDIGAVEVVTNTLPTITGATISRQKGSPASVSQIATVGDAEQPLSTLSVAATLSTGSGVSVSGISVGQNGTVTALVGAACAATASTFALVVTDAGNLTANASLIVNVTPNSAPTVTVDVATQTRLGTASIGAVTVSATSAQSRGNALTISTQFSFNNGPLQLGLPSGLSLTAGSNNGTTIPGKASWQLSGTAPSAAGTYKVTFSVTDGCSTGAITTTLIVTAVPAADLVVTSLKVPDSAKADSNFTVKYTVKNSGTVAAVKSKVTFYLSTDGACCAGDVLLGSDSVKALKAGASQSDSKKLKIPKHTTVGNYVIFAVADGLNAVVEGANEGNNQRSTSIKVK